MEIHDWRHKFLQGNNRDQFDHKRDDFDPRIYIPNHWSLLHMYDYSDHGFKTTSDHFSDNFELWSLNLKNLCARHATRVCVMLANKSVMSVTFGDVKVPWSSRLLDRLEYLTISFIEVSCVSPDLHHLKIGIQDTHFKGANQKLL